MNWFDKLDIIKEKLLKAGREDLVEEIVQFQYAGGTPGEIFASIVYRLSKYEKEEIDAYVLAKPEVDFLINYAKSIGYLS